MLKFQTMQQIKNKGLGGGSSAYSSVDILYSIEECWKVKLQKEN